MGFRPIRWAECEASIAVDSQSDLIVWSIHVRRDRRGILVRAVTENFVRDAVDSGPVDDRCASQNSPAPERRSQEEATKHERSQRRALTRVERASKHCFSPLQRHHVFAPIVSCLLDHSLPAMSFPFALFLLLTLLLASVSAQGTSIILPTTAAPTATALATAKGYSYVGCWNETVGVPNSNGARALSGGMSVRP